MKNVIDFFRLVDNARKFSFFKISPWSQCKIKLSILTSSSSTHDVWCGATRPIQSYKRLWATELTLICMEAWTNGLEVVSGLNRHSLLDRFVTTSRDQSKVSVFSHDWLMLRVIIDRTTQPKLKNAVRIWREPLIQSVWSNSNRARHHSRTCRGSKNVYFWSISLHALSERLIVTHVVQVVGSSGLECCLQGMSRISSPNPGSIWGKLDVVLSGVARDPL